MARILVAGNALDVAQSRAEVIERMLYARQDGDTMITVLVRTKAGGASVGVREDTASVLVAHVQAVIE